MDDGVEAAASPQCMVPLQARLELVNAIGQLNVGHALLLPGNAASCQYGSRTVVAWQRS